VQQRPYFHKRLRYYLDFCQKYSLAPTDRWSVPAFDEKLRSKNQSEAQRQQARQAVAVYFEALDSGRAEFTRSSAGGKHSQIRMAKNPKDRICVFPQGDDPA